MLKILKPTAQPAFLYESTPVHGSDPSRFSPAASLPGYHPVSFSNQKPKSDSPSGNEPHLLLRFPFRPRPQHLEGSERVDVGVYYKHSRHCDNAPIKSRPAMRWRPSEGIVPAVRYDLLFWTSRGREGGFWAYEGRCDDRDGGV